MQAIFSGERLPYEELETSDDSALSESGFSNDDAVDGDGSAEYESRVRLQECREIITRLIKLSRQIKPPQTRFTGNKAIRYKPIDPDTEVDLLDQFYLFDKEHIKEVLRHLRSGSTGPFPLDNYLVTRLAKASLRRRQQLMYWKRHRDKLQRVVKSEGGGPSGFGPAPTQGQDQLQATSRDFNDRQSKLHPPTLISSPTTATAIEDQVVDVDDMRSDYSSVSGTSFVSDLTSSLPMSNDLEQFEMLAPPKSLLNGTHFECPICFTLLNRRSLKERAWR